MSREGEHIEERRKRETVGLLMELIQKVQNDEWILTGESRSYVELDGFPYRTGEWELQFQRKYKQP